MRAEAERLVREAMAKKLTVKKVDTRIETKCGKCGAANKVSFPPGSTRVNIPARIAGIRRPLSKRRRDATAGRILAARVAVGYVRGFGYVRRSVIDGGHGARRARDRHVGRRSVCAASGRSVLKT